MLIDWISLGVFALCVITCAVIIWRTLPKLASIRTEAIPKHQQEIRKQQILDHRLQQKLGAVEAAVVRTVVRGAKWLGGGTQQLIHTLRTKEREYHRQLLTQQAMEDPEAVRARVAQGLAEAQAALDAGDLASAEQHFVDVVSVDQKNLDAYIGLADVAIAKKDYPNAREALQFVLKLQQGSSVAYERLGRVAGIEGKLDEAEADLLKSVSLNASTASTQFELAELEMKLGHADTAQKAYEEAVKLEPANPKYLDALLQFAIEEKRKPLAEKTLERLRETNPDNQKLDELAKTVKSL